MGGGELFDAITERAESGLQYTEEWARGIAIDICKALAYLHKKDIVHRDLKPENLLLDRKKPPFKVKLADFGFADAMRPGKRQMHARLGTPGYVAPEILADRPYGVEVDMWSFGVVLYILLCGYPPFDSEEEEELSRNITGAEYDYDEPEWEHISKDAKDLIDGLFVLDQKKRLTADQVLNDKWMKADLSKGEVLDAAAARLKQYNAKRRWRRAGKVCVHPSK